MTAELVFQQALNGLSFGALLFILAAGLSLIFGMMDVVNLAHGAFYMLGAYVALSVTRVTGSYWVALVVAPLALAALGLVVEPLLLRRLRGRHLDQVLITIGLSLVIADFIRLRDDWGWGATVRSLPFPPGLDRSIPVAGSGVVGPADTFGKVLFPQFALALIFAIMALVLLFRPTGLLGRVRIGR